MNLACIAWNLLSVRSTISIRSIWKAEKASPTSENVSRTRKEYHIEILMNHEIPLQTSGQKCNPAHMYQTFRGCGVEWTLDDSSNLPSTSLK